MIAAIIVYDYFSRTDESEKKSAQQIMDNTQEYQATDNEEMIIVAPQLNDWGQTSANQTIALTQYFLTHYKIDQSKVYINGYSCGGETLSLVLSKQPEIFAAALMCSSKWDGAYKPVVETKTPVYFVIGEGDEYYGSEPFKETYQIYSMYGSR